MFGGGRKREEDWATFKAEALPLTAAVL